MQQCSSIITESLEADFFTSQERKEEKDEDVLDNDEMEELKIHLIGDMNEDIAQFLSVGVSVDDDNEPALENDHRLYYT